MLFKYIGSIFPLALSFTHGNVSSVYIFLSNNISQRLSPTRTEESSFLFMILFTPHIIWFIAANDEHLRSYQCFAIANRLQ